MTPFHERFILGANVSHRFTQFFSHIDIPPEQVHILDGTVQDLKEECATYEKRIKDVGGIDLFLAGIGEDGHLAFNEPGESHPILGCYLLSDYD